MGTAGDYSVADRNALANLSQQLEVSVKDTVSDLSIARTHLSGSGESTDNTRRSARQTTIFTDRVLEGAKVVEHWKEERGAQTRYYSLAMLEKAPLARRLRADIRRSDQRIERWLRYESEQAGTPVQALSALHRAHQQSTERHGMNRDLTVVSGSGVDPPRPTDAIAAQFRERLTSLILRLVASDDWQSLLEGSVEQLGINQGEDTDYRLTMTVDQGPVERSADWVWLRGAIELELIQATSTIASTRDPFKISASKASDINVRLRDHLAQSVPRALFELLISADPGVDPAK